MQNKSNKPNALDFYIKQRLQQPESNPEESQIMLSFEVAQELIRAVKQVAFTDDKYWDIHQIAHYLGVSAKTVHRHFISDPRWPKAITYGNPKQLGKRWLASECRKALLLFREDSHL